jgi:hypothetical protein
MSVPAKSHQFDVTRLERYRRMVSPTVNDLVLQLDKESADIISCGRMSKPFESYCGGSYYQDLTGDQQQ